MERAKISYVPSIIMLMGFCAVVYKMATTPDLSKAESLLELRGKLKEYSFSDNTGYKKRGRQYYLWMEEHAAKFQIKADFISGFKKADFQYEMHPGSIIVLQIAKEHETYLSQTEDQVFVYGIRGVNRTYLDSEKTVAIETGYGKLVLAAIFLSGSTLFFFMARRNRKKLVS